MKNEKKSDFIWDTTIDYEEYPTPIKKIFLKFYLKEEKKFHNWLSSISLKHQNDIDWWVTNPLSRNPYSSSLYKSLCLILTIKALIRKKKLPRIIYVDSIFLKRTINSNIKIINKKCIIIPKKKFIYFSFFFLRNINSIILFLKSYFLTIIFSKKKMIIILRI